MRKIVFYLLFAGVVFSGFFLRFVNLSNNPPSLNWDEISFGYNAYSVLKTGHDECGRLGNSMLVAAKTGAYNLTIKLKAF